MKVKQNCGIDISKDPGATAFWGQHNIITQQYDRDFAKQWKAEYRVHVNMCHYDDFVPACVLVLPFGRTKSWCSNCPYCTIRVAHSYF